ncbi:MAG: ligase-associated DNA damage response endonuclease PdeM [Caulobacteraceae bacterium]|nr:ligase-associated DNA damage response endonuclease PdeM [Caulobacteraceae bacterium]
MTGTRTGWRYAFDAHPGGGLRLGVAGVETVCRPAGALWLEAWKALIVADLHFEKGSAYAARGQLLPPYDTGETLRRLEAEVAALAPRILIFLGDSFHDRRGEGRLAERDVARLAALAVGRTLIWVVGNHDRDGPRRLPGEVVPGLTVAGLTLVHEPAERPAPGEVAGHLHPCARVGFAGGAVRRRCFVTDAERLILPAFGAFAGGLNVRHQAFARLLSRPPLAAVLGETRVHAVGWASLRGD